MPGLHSTLARLKTLRVGPSPVQSDGVDRLRTLEAFGSNPGALVGRTYVPADLPVDAPLIVVLHGCTQTAAGYDHAAGWSRAADRHGFALLFPEQSRANNPNLCFNWFSPTDTTRGSGEALSIRQMIAAVQDAHATDPAKLFVTGLSAGGAMTAVMLATYPELFAGGAIIAGLPYGTAQSIPAALERMRGAGLPGPAELTRLVHEAAPAPAHWPTLSVWHGTADATVVPANGEALVAQWRGLQGLVEAPTRTEQVGRVTRRRWQDAAGQTQVEHIVIAGLGHGTPLQTGAAGSDEHVAPHMLEAGISATGHMLAEWGITAAPVHRAIPARVPSAALPISRQAAPKSHVLHPIRAKHARVPDPITRTIESALRKAGLMR